MQESLDNEQVLKLKDLDQTEPRIEKLLRYSSIYYILVFLVVGLPIWYATTTTYRADLPFSDIEKFSQVELTFQFNFELVFSDKTLDENYLAKAKDEFMSQLSNQKLNSKEGLTINYDVQARKLNTQEDDLFTTTGSLKDLDNLLFQRDVKHHNQLTIYNLDKSLSTKYKLITVTDQTLFLNSIYTVNYKTDKLLEILKNDYITLDHLANTYNLKQESDRRKLPSKNQLRIISFDSDYEIIYSTINSYPEVFKLDLNMESEIKGSFGKIFKQLSTYININVKSQQLYYSEFDSYNFKTSNINNETTYTLSPSDLSQMTNAIETRVGSHGTQTTAINFVTYIPKRQPLRLDAEINAFLVPRWGGIYILNSEFEENIQMKVFQTHLMQLLDISIHKNEFTNERDSLYASEIQNYLVKRTLENILNSINTLQSLASLLEKISNMIISEHIGKQVYESVESTKRAIALARNGLIHEAFQCSREAFVSSEKAFFDPSLLELLYFPEDQKFAIYIPLFIPVGLPLLLSLKKLIQWYKDSKNKIKSE